MSHDAARRTETPSRTGLSVCVIRDPSALRALRSDWSRLHAATRDASLFMHPDWLITWWDVFGSAGGRALQLLVCYDVQRLVGIAPLLSRRHQYRFGLRFRRLELLGSGEDAADETCADYLGFLIEHGYERTVCDAFVRAICTGRCGRWEEFVVQSMSESNSIAPLLETAFSQYGAKVHLHVWGHAPYLRLPVSWDAYLASVSSTKRARLRKTLRRYEGWSGGPPVVRRVLDEADLDRGLQVLEQLHQQRWADAGAFKSRRFREFHRRVAHALFDAGAVDIGWLEVRGNPIAAFYNFLWNRRLYYYQSGRVLDVPADVAVGLVAHACNIRHAIEQSIEEYDFLHGLARYKLSLASDVRPLVYLRAARRTWKESLREFGLRLESKFGKTTRVNAGRDAATSLAGMPDHAEALDAET